MNQDVWINDKTIEQLLEINRENEDFGILSSIHISGEGSHFDHNFLSYVCSGKGSRLLEDMYFEKPLKSVYPVDFVNGAAWLINRPCVRKVGLLNPPSLTMGLT